MERVHSIFSNHSRSAKFWKVVADVHILKPKWPVALLDWQFNIMNDWHFPCYFAYSLLGQSFSEHGHVFEIFLLTKQACLSSNKATFILNQTLGVTQRIKRLLPGDTCHYVHSVSRRNWIAISQLVSQFDYQRHLKCLSAYLHDNGQTRFSFRASSIRRHKTVQTDVTEPLCCDEEVRQISPLTSSCFTKSPEWMTVTQRETNNLKKQQFQLWPTVRTIHKNRGLL